MVVQTRQRNVTTASARPAAPAELTATPSTRRRTPRRRSPLPPPSPPSLNGEDDDDEEEDEEEQTAAEPSSITKASLRMMLTAAPDELPCREDETKRVLEHVQVAVASNTGGGCLYISGMPGTGKTATVTAALRQLKQSPTLPNFDVVEVNAMRVPSANAVYQVIYRGLFKSKAPAPDKSYQALDKYFSSSNKRRPVCVLIIDEIDGLVTKRQNVLYTLFDWPTQKNSRLAVIAIANTIDLPERMIPRCASRLGFGRLDFFPYKKEEIVEIVKRRLTDAEFSGEDQNVPKKNKKLSGAATGGRKGRRQQEEETGAESSSRGGAADVGISFDASAVEMCARKVASLSGDVRRALHICRRALEIAHSNGNTRVQLQDVAAAAKELYQSPSSDAVRKLPYVQKLFLLAVVLELRRLNQSGEAGGNVVALLKVLERIRTDINLCGEYGSSAYVSVAQAKAMAAKLADLDLITVFSELPTTAPAPANSKTATSSTSGRKNAVHSTADEDGADLAVSLVSLVSVASNPTTTSPRLAADLSLSSKKKWKSFFPKTLSV